MTVADRDRMLEAQGGVCAICKTAVEFGRRYSGAVDHCHATGKIRGILCYPCNTGLGVFKDKVDSLRAAIDYLESNK